MIIKFPRFSGSLSLYTSRYLCFLDYLPLSLPLLLIAPSSPSPQPLSLNPGTLQSAGPPLRSAEKPPLSFRAKTRVHFDSIISHDDPRTQHQASPFPSFPPPRLYLTVNKYRR